MKLVQVLENGYGECRLILDDTFEKLSEYLSEAGYDFSFEDECGYWFVRDGFDDMVIRKRR